MAYEAINNMDRRRVEGQMALKVDINNALDLVEWHFLVEVLSCFEFCDKFRNQIKVLLASSRISTSHMDFFLALKE